MPEAIPFQLRIFCLCGQKMKVSSDMLGKPGKCVACRQKLRIPSVGELGPDEVVIHLKDHPEYLRNPGGAAAELPAFPEEGPGDLDRDDVLLEADGGEAAAAFVRYEPIRRLCNYEHKVKRQLQCIREGRPAELDKATLMSYRGLARQSRQRLEGAIRDELIAIGAELRTLEEALTGRQLALRTGEAEHVAYSKAVLPLRRRREVLVYRQQNLRGWLATEDPHLAGGLDDVALADVPTELFTGTFPLEEDLEGLPLENAVVRLERALRDRETADRLLNELHRMSLDGVIAVDELARRRADTEAERQRARTAIAFYRGRLEQVIQDCEEDSSALQAYEVTMRGQLNSAAIAHDVFKRLEEAIFRAQVDIKRARNLASRALNANAASDVPNPHGTFLERLARPGLLRGLGVDSWLAWAASVLLLIKLFVPVATQAPGGPGIPLDGAAIATFSAAAAAALSATVVIRALRGALLSIVWLALTAGGAYFLANGPLLEGGAGDSAWWLTAGGMLAVGAWLLLGMAATVSFFSPKPLRWVAAANLLVGAGVALTLLSNFFGYFEPLPRLGAPVSELDAFTGTYGVQVPLGNDGRTPFWIGDGGGPEHRSSYLLEYRVGDSSWAEAGPPARIVAGGREIAYPPGGRLALDTGDRVVFHYQLPPGLYRLQLLPAWRGGLPLRHTFQLDPPDPAATRAADIAIEPEPRPGPAEATTGVDVELRGVLVGQGGGPKFSVIVRERDGTERREQLSLGDRIHGDWTISEFSPAHNTMTVVNGDRLLIIERGNPERLDD